MPLDISVDERQAMQLQTAIQLTIGTLWERGLDRCEWSVGNWIVSAQRLMSGYEVKVMVKDAK